MVSQPRIESEQAIAEKRVVLSGLHWNSYLQILHALPETRAARLTYDRGTLEITMALEDHEFAIRLIELFIRIWVYEMGLNMKTMGSTTINRESLNRGAEPDCAYYIQHQPQAAGRPVNFEVDPPPDLVVEVDLTHTDIDKNRFYAAIGVPEFWRYNGQELTIYQLQGDCYQECDRSPVFPQMKKEDLYRFLQTAERDEVAAERWLRGLAIEQMQQHE
ncbi:Uma2 family endonuclease [Roseofilum casamattae]|nr:Uma2 family endonuclease [Roseofilum casamattae]